MGIKITSVAEALDKNGLKFLVHGMAGVGKTVLCATTGAPTLIISAESGLLSIAGAPSYIKTTVVKTIHELEEAYDFLEENIDMFEWVCLDSISEIAEVLLADEKRGSKDPRQAYGNLSDRMLGIMRSFRDLEGVNVLFTCKQERQVDGDTNITRFVPMLPGKSLTNSISYLFDEVFAMRVEKDEDNEDYRVLQTGRDRNYEAKDRSGLLDMFEEPNLKRIAAKIREGQIDEEENETVDASDEIVAKQQEEILTEPEDEKVAEESSSLEIVNDTDSPMYLYHDASDAVLKLEVGDSIDDDGNVAVIDYKTFIKHKKRIESEEDLHKDN